ncbi:MAG: hypothetical protein Tsb0014_23020 [Pleurocapsa sp.]
MVRQIKKAMSDFHELLICLSCGLVLLILLSGFIGNQLIIIEVPLLRKIPCGLVIAVALALYGCFGLIALGLGKIIIESFTLTPKIRLMLGITATATSYYFGNIIMEMFRETPYQKFCDRDVGANSRAIGLTATIRYPPQLLPTAKPGDALVWDSQEKITQIVTIYLPHWAEEKQLRPHDTVWIIDHIPQQNAYLVIKTGGRDELNWQNLHFY